MVLEVVVVDKNVVDDADNSDEKLVIVEVANAKADVNVFKVLDVFADDSDIRVALVVHTVDEVVDDES